MKPTTQMHTIVFAISTSILFFFKSIIDKHQVTNEFLGLLITFTLSATFYKAIYKSLIILFSRFRFIRKLFLGRYYVEGSWGGFYVCNGFPELFYEIYEQSIDHITIKGYGYDLNGKYICNWTILNPFINIEESQFSYYYELNEITQKDIIMGFANGSVEWGKDNKACKCVGFAFDEASMDNQPFFSVKLSENKIQTPNSILPKDIFEQIYKIYEQNKHSFSITSK